MYFDKVIHFMTDHYYANINVKKLIVDLIKFRKLNQPFKVWYLDIPPAETVHEIQYSNHHSIHRKEK